MLTANDGKTKSRYVSGKYNVERFVQHCTTVVTRGLHRYVWSVVVPVHFFKHDGATALCYV
jgi:hypothetical protein